jgi:ATP-dependent RNA helicase RhlE
MLDMGFIRDIRKIVAKIPPQRQTLFFSATMPTEIEKLVSELLRDPVRVAVTPQAKTADRVEQRIVHIERSEKGNLLAEMLKSEPVDRALVFTRTKHGADKVVRALQKAGIASEAIHGNKSQNNRERALANFRSGRVRTLIATDIAARGIDVDGVSHVFNYDLPNVPESYVHRIGRTARAGAEGIAISFCDRDEVPFLRDIEKLIRLEIPSTDRRRDKSSAPRTAASVQPAQNRNRNHRGRPNGNRQGRPEGRPGQHGRPQQPRGEHSNGNNGKIETVLFMQRKRPHRGNAGANGAHRPAQ